MAMHAILLGCTPLRGCRMHACVCDALCAMQPNSPTYHNTVIYIPVNPVMSTTKTYIGRLTEANTTNSARVMGTIGIAVNGVAIYNDANAEGADAVTVEWATLDGCRGHACEKEEALPAVLQRPGIMAQEAASPPAGRGTC